MKKKISNKKTSKEVAVKEVAVKEVAVKEVVNPINEVAKLQLMKYCYDESNAAKRSCAKQVTKLIIDNALPLAELQKFACNFYDELYKAIPIEKRPIWLTGRKGINANGKEVQDNPKTTWKKHVSWLFSKQAIAVNFDNGKYFIKL